MNGIAEYLKDFPKEAKKNNELSFVMTGSSGNSPVDIFAGVNAESFSFRTSVAAMIGLSRTFLDNLDMKEEFRGANPEDIVGRGQLFELFEKAKKMRGHGKNDDVTDEMAAIMTRLVMICNHGGYKNKATIAATMLFMWSMDLMPESQIEKLFTSWAGD